MSKKSSSGSRSGWLLRQDSASSFSRVFASLRGTQLSLHATESREEAPLAAYDVENAVVDIPDPSRTSKRFAITVALASQAHAHSSATSAAASAVTAAVPLLFACESKEDQETWLTALSVSSVGDAWPGGVDFSRRPCPLLYSIWVARHAAHAAMTRGSASGQSGAAASAIPSPFPRLPLLKAAASWARKSLLLQKLRLCSIVFEGVDARSFLEDRETKRNTLLEIVDFADGAGRSVFTDFRVLEDAFTMIRLNLFRSLPQAPEPTGNPDEEEEPQFTDPQWPHFSIVYELLLRLVTTDHLDLGFKKKVIDPSFVKQLMALFDSEDPRERDYLKTITHRIYSKLTQRRALIRRVICNVFYEFVYETEEHHGIAEMLEILASIINGFAVPIKDEHKTMLVKALLPLHKAKGIIAYHPQLSYCMALYVSKDHTLTRDVIPSLVKFWPFGNSQKQIMFLNELEDLFEYVLEDDLEAIREVLALRLARCIGGLHFQVAERTLLLWNSERFAHLMLEHPAHRAAVLPILFPALYSNSEGHWHESIRTVSAGVLEQYKELDPDTFTRCFEMFELKLAQQAAAAALQVTVPSTPGGVLPGAAASASPGMAAARTSSPAMQISPGMSFSPPGLHAHKAPAVRATSSFTDISHADLLPGQRESPLGQVMRKERFVPSSLVMPLSSMDGGGAADGADE